MVLNSRHIARHLKHTVGCNYSRAYAIWNPGGGLAHYARGTIDIITVVKYLSIMEYGGKSGGDYNL